VTKKKNCQLVPTDPIEFEELEKMRGWMCLLFHR